MDEKVRLYSLTFLPIFAPFSKIEKVAENGQKVKVITLPFCEFLPLFQQSLKIDEKLRLYPYFFANFLPFFKNEKVAQNGRKGKGYCLIFCQFSPLLQK